MKVVSKNNFITLKEKYRERKLFDFSAGLWGEVVNPSRVIKNHLNLLNHSIHLSVEQEEVFLRHQLKAWSNKYKELENEFTPFMVSDALWYSYLFHPEIANTKSYFLNFEYDYLSSRSEQENELPNNEGRAIMSDLYYLFNPKHHFDRLTTLTVYSTFPEIKSYLKEPMIETIVIVGSHPAGLGGYRLVWSRNKENYFSTNQISLYHLKLYGELIKKFFFVKTKYTNRFKAELLKQVGKFTLQTTSLPNLFRIPLSINNLNKLLDNKIAEYHKSNNRLIVGNSTFIYDERYLYIYLPINTELTHLKNKWKDLYQVTSSL